MALLSRVLKQACYIITKLFITPFIKKELKWKPNDETYTMGQNHNAQLQHEQRMWFCWAVMVVVAAVVLVDAVKAWFD